MELALAHFACEVRRQEAASASDVHVLRLSGVDSARHQVALRTQSAAEGYAMPHAAVMGAVQCPVRAGVECPNHS